MLFNYKALDNTGKSVTGSIEAVTLDVAIGSLQKRGLIVVLINPENRESWAAKLGFGKGVSYTMNYQIKTDILSGGRISQEILCEFDGVMQTVARQVILDSQGATLTTPRYRWDYRRPGAWLPLSMRDHGEHRTWRGWWGTLQRTTVEPAG